MKKGHGQSVPYEILYTKAADKFFKSHEKIRQKYESGIYELLFGEHPEMVDVKRIQGKKSVYYRMKIGDHRVIYTVVNGKIIVVSTLLAGTRGDIYKKTSGLK